VKEDGELAPEMKLKKRRGIMVGGTTSEAT